jgi:hypothetical protein
MVDVVEPSSGPCFQLVPQRLGEQDRLREKRHNQQSVHESQYKTPRRTLSEAILAIRQKRGDTLVGTLRDMYGSDFAPGARSDMRLDTLLDRTGAQSLTDLIHGNRRR